MEQWVRLFGISANGSTATPHALSLALALLAGGEMGERRERERKSKKTGGVAAEGRGGLRLIENKGK